MKRFNNVKMTLFDSTNANFRLAIEAQFVRGNSETGYRDLVYVTDKASAILNPNIYLTLSCKGEDLTPVYTSYPQLYKLRATLETIKDYVVGDGFIEKDGEVFVSQNYNEPVIISNIGKNNNWISFKLVVIKSGENGVFEYIPGVSIELSTSDRFVSTLTVDEFLTVYTIIKDLNLANIQCMLSLAFLDAAPAQAMQQTQTYYQPQVQQPMYQQPYVPQYQQQPYQPQQGYVQPRYNGNSSYRAQPQGQYTKQQPRVQAPQPQQTIQEAQVVKQPVEDSTPYMKPRSAATPILNFKNVEDTPITTIEDDFDDTEALEDIFRGSEE